MRNSIFKKLTSLIVAMCIVATLVPAAFADTTESGNGTLVYSFMQSTYGTGFTSATGISYSKGNMNMEYLDDNSTEGNTNDFPLAFDGTTNKSVRFQLYGWGRNDSVYQYAAFKIKGIEMNEYNISFDYGKSSLSSSARSASVYILDPETTAQILRETEEQESAIKEAITKNIATPLFSGIDMYSETPTSGNKKTTFLPTEAGEHLLVFINRSSSSYNNRMLFPQKLTLTPIPNHIDYNTASTSQIDVKTLTYGNTGGRIEYYGVSNSDSNGSVNYGTPEEPLWIPYMNTYYSKWWAFKIRIPEAGNYDLELLFGENSTATNGNMYLLPVAETDDITESLKNPLLSKVPFYNANSNTTNGLTTNTVTKTFSAPSAGEYYMVWQNAMPSSSWNHGRALRPARLTLTGGTGITLIFSDISLDKTVLEVDGTATLTKGKTFYSTGKETDNTDVRYISTNTDVATLSGTTITAVAPGITKIQAVRADGYVLDEETVTVNTPEYTEAFGENTYEKETGINVNPAVVAAAYAKGETISQSNTNATDNGNGTWTVSTDETLEGFSFRYWARGLETGNRRIVSLEKSFTYSPEKGDANYLIAVYADDSDTENKEYFNANGQLIPDADENYKPYMLGYGYATGWKDNGNGIKEAVYGEGVKSYKISVNGVEKSYDYGTKITCPTVEAPEGKYFLGWKKTVGGKETAELVSTDMNYSFYAWENCVVTPAFGDAEATFTGIARKILISSFAIENGDSVVMAEFIGFDNAVERGITLDKDYAMSNKNANQFTIINDVDVATVNISGYAILADGTKFIYNLIKNK